jgi:hypothetical protein
MGLMSSLFSANDKILGNPLMLILNEATGFPSLSR